MLESNPVAVQLMSVSKRLEQCATAISYGRRLNNDALVLVHEVLAIHAFLSQQES